MTPAGIAATQPRLLVIEDEYPMRHALTNTLTAAGYRVVSAENGETGLEKALAERPEAILLDVMMPRLDGFSVAGQLRRTGFTAPILMLTAKAGIADRVRGLDAGADDYLAKPFSTDELLARIRALLRRVRRDGQPVLTATIGEVDLDFARLEARRAGRHLHLTPKEFAMLRLLIEAEGQPVSRERFLDVVWGYSAFPTTRTIDTHIASLRTKLEPDPAKPRYLKTVFGVGYRLETKPADADRKACPSPVSR